jgi:uncharacterized protein (DUF433 family)
MPWYVSVMTTEWLVSDPEVLGGKPCVRGSRISVQFILELVASGASVEDIHRQYPEVPSEGIAAALRYAANSLKNEISWDVKLSA